MENRTFFIKPSRSLAGETKLDPILVSKNKHCGIETSLTLDTNILISMEKVVKSGNKWSSLKKYGLHNLVTFLQRCPPGSICIAPGFALGEMPAEAANRSREFYELFVSAHLHGFVDTPNSIKSTFIDPGENHGFESLPYDAQSFMAIPFACIAYLNLIDKNQKGKPIEKFNSFLDCLENKVDILSAAEIEIAKYCFSEPAADCTDLIKIRKKIRRNFLKTNDDKSPKDAQEMISIAFNAASDILLLHSANIADKHGIDGIPQDSWIATRDKKLVEFSNVFHHVNIDGETGKYAAGTLTPEQAKDFFWQQTSTEVMLRGLRRADYNLSRTIDKDKIIEAAHSAIREIRQYFQQRTD